MDVDLRLAKISGRVSRSSRDWTQLPRHFDTVTVVSNKTIGSCLKSVKLKILKK